MDWRKKVGLAMVILGVGLAAALQFRKLQSHETPGSARPWSAPATVDSLDVASNPSAAAPSTPSFAGRIESTPDSPAGSTPGATAATGAGDRSTKISPSVPATSPGAPSSADLFARFAEADRQRSASRGSSLSPSLVDLNAPHRMHKIADGDTLSALAERYLGDADRYGELYQCNRDVLRSPDVLPIGAELRIPSAIPLQPSAEDSAGMNPSTAPLQPVPAAPTVPTSAKRAPPRTYTVQPGDNLVDVARKLYGDGRRHEQLYEANRRLMRHPGDLKPGTVLTVP